MKKDKKPRGFKCECGTFHPFGPYVAAHYNLSLIHTCPQCGAQHKVLNYDVSLIKATQKPRVQVA